MSVPAVWVTDPTRIESTARNLLAANPTAPAVWIGHRGGTEPKVTLLYRDGQRLQMQHEPANTFGERLRAVLAGEQASSKPNGSADALARQILEAGQ